MDGRRAISPLFATLILFGISASFAGIVASGFSGVSYNTMKCEIQSLDIVEITTDNYWGTLKAMNTGNHVIDGYSLIVYGGTASITQSSTDIIQPGDFLSIEFQVNDFLETEMTIQLDISNENHSANCIKQVMDV